MRKGKILPQDFTRICMENYSIVTGGDRQEFFPIQVSLIFGGHCNTHEIYG